MGLINKLTGKFVRVPEGHERFSGTYHGGKATYYYINQNDEQIFDGDFSYKSSHRVEYGTSNYEIKGTYVNNRKHGKWVYKHTTSNLNTKLTVNYENGHYMGLFIYDETSINLTGDAVKTYLEMTLQRRWPEGVIRGYLEGRFFSGGVDDRGLPHGEWVLSPEDNDDYEAIETEIWDHGTFVKATKRKNADSGEKETRPRLREMINSILDNDCQRMFNMVRRGTMDEFLHIGRVVPSK